MAINGYCLVCYISTNKAVKGSAEFTATHAGKTYHFVNKEAVSAFKKNPSKYLPAYDGCCAYGMTFGKKVEVDPTVFSIVNGKLYLNKNAKVGKTFEKDKAKHIAKADQEWAKLK
jgi:YHS domain-containing protein